MSNERERLALEWAKRIKSVPREYHDETYHAVADIVLAHIKPTTMADVEWDEDEHYLTGAVYQQSRTLPTDDVIMIHKDYFGTVSAIMLEYKQLIIDKASKFTPNGKKYKIVELPDHLSVLDSVQGFWDAPEGTVVGTDDGLPWWKGGGSWVCGDGSGRRTPNEMFDEEGSVEVLRWDWGGEE